MRILWPPRGNLLLSTLLIVAAVFALINVMAAIHAYRFTHYSESHQATSRPEKLAFWQKIEVLLTGVSLPRPTVDRTPEYSGLGFETVTFSAGEVKLDAWLVPIRPSKGIVLLFAGYGSCKSDLLPEIVALNGLGYSCLAVDFRGTGRSEGYEVSLGYHEAEDVAAAVEYCRRLYPDVPIVLLGQSMGGAAVLRAVGELGVEADAVIIECVFARLVTTIENRFSLFGLPSFPFAQLLTFWGGAHCGFDAFDHNPVDYASGVTCPALFLHGSEDKRAHLDDVRRVVENCENSQGPVVFEGLGHDAPIRFDSLLWSESISRFLDVQLH
ncbi:MAG: lysophospholipase [bacterium]|nr:lysophospholipase [bacterium]